MNTPAQGFLAPGTVLNHTYEITQLVGEGGTGEVYLARNQATGREIAIKRLKKEFATDPTLVELMQREANALHEIRHPAVVRYYDLLRTDIEGGFTFLVMEFIRGESLPDRMKRGPLPGHEIKQIARRIIDGLEVAHAGNVLHRDLTPANVILRDGNPADATLIDFGIAKDLGQSNKTVLGGGFAGTYRYASPEQINSEPLDSRSDFYSLGATLLAAAEGSADGDSKSLGEIMAMKARVPDTSALPGDVRPLIEALMQPRKEDRPGTAADIRVLIDGMGDGGDLDSLIDGVSQPAAPPPLSATPANAGRNTPASSGKSPPPKKKSGGGILLPAIILLVAAGLGGAAYFLLPGMLEEPLPVASPYELDLKVEDETASLTGNAPSEEAAAALKQDLKAAVDGKAIDGTLTLADGLPSEDWALAVAELALAAKPLGTWALSVADTSAVLTGTAPDPVVYSLVQNRSNEIATLRNLDFDFQVALAPQPLSRSSLLAASATFSKCGPFKFQGPDPLPPGDPIRLSGMVASESDAVQLRQAMIDLDSSRSINLDLSIASEMVCKVERLLPQANAPQLTFGFSYGQKDGGPEGAKFIQGDNPVVDLSIADSYADAFLYVFYIDGNTSKVIHLLPYKDRPENQIDKAGAKDGDRYNVRVLYPASDVKVGQRGFLVGPPYGTNILVAVASPRAFLERLLPRNDTAELFLEDLVEALTRAETTEYIVTREFFSTTEN